MKIKHPLWTVNRLLMKLKFWGITPLSSNRVKTLPRQCAGTHPSAMKVVVKETTKASQVQSCSPIHRCEDAKPETRFTKSCYLFCKLLHQEQVSALQVPSPTSQDTRSKASDSTSNFAGTKLATFDCLRLLSCTLLGRQHMGLSSLTWTANLRPWLSSSPSFLLKHIKSTMSLELSSWSSAWPDITFAGRAHVWPPSVKSTMPCVSIFCRQARRLITDESAPSASCQYQTRACKMNKVTSKGMVQQQHHNNGFQVETDNTPKAKRWSLNSDSDFSNI